MNKSYIKYLNRALIVVFTLIALVLSIKSSDNLEDVDFQKDNFVNLKIKSELYACIGNGDTGSISSLEDICINTGTLSESTASGLSIKSVDGKTYTLTAAHFCSVYVNQSVDLGVIMSQVWIVNNEGQTFRGEIVYSDDSSDLCLVSSSMPLEEDIELASSLPVTGEKIYAISSPLSISEDGVLLHFEGFFSGCNSKRICFYTIPATHGSSGSIVFNENGKAIGMIQMVPVEFDNVSIGIGRDTISEFLREASRQLYVDVSI